jgi:multisubunit Na+/H+ antiporter MnhB subunit
MNKLKTLKNPYSILSLVLVLIAVGLVFYSPQGAFVGILVLTLAAGLRLLHGIRSKMTEQLGVSREIASWLSSIHHQNNPQRISKSYPHDPSVPQA